MAWTSAKTIADTDNPDIVTLSAEFTSPVDAQVFPFSRRERVSTGRGQFITDAKAASVVWEAGRAAVKTTDDLLLADLNR